MPPATSVTSVDMIYAVYPQVVVNGAGTNVLAKFMVQDEVLYTSSQTLAQLGVRVPSSNLAKARWLDNAQSPGQRLFALNSIKGLQFAYDAARQNLNLVAPLEWLNLSTTSLGKLTEKPYEVGKAGFATVLNYDINVAQDNKRNRSLGLLTQWRFTTPWGYFSNTHLFNYSKSTQGHSSNKLSRLDTYWRSAWPKQGITLTLGDTTTSQLGGGGSRIGGIRIEKGYGLQPWRNTTPLASYLGKTTLPSTIDLYLNGVKQYSKQVPAGEYEISLPPSINGRGIAKVVATDVLGRTIAVDMPLYGGSGLLAKGLNEWSLEAGFLRTDYGGDDFSYNKNPVVSGTLRYGLSNYLTPTLHLEAAPNAKYWQGGLELKTVLGPLGQLNISHSESHFRDKRGRQNSVFFSTQLGRVSLSTGWSRYDDAFTNLGSTLYPQAFKPKGEHTTNISAGVSWGSNKLGSWSLGYVRSQQSNKPVTASGTLSWSRSLGKRGSINIGGSKTFSGNKDYSIYAGLSFSLGKGYSTSVSAQRSSTGSRSHQANLQKSSSGLHNLSWSLGWQQQTSARGTRRHSGTGSIHYRTQYGNGSARAYTSDGNSNYSASWRGGLVLMQGGLFATRNVSDSFAVVSTQGVASVPVLSQNSVVGKTNRKGLLLVPNLSAYQKNKISIDPLNLPANMKIERAQAQVTPRAGASVAVAFKLRRVQSAMLTLVNTAGGPLPVGASILNMKGQPVAVVGFDGQTYIEELEKGANRFNVALPEGGSCTVQVNYTAPTNNDAILLNLGEMICEE